MTDLLTLENVFLFVSIFSTLLYVIKMVLFFFVGGDSEVDASFDTITETEISFNFISMQSILAFFMGFGWSGLSALIQFQTGGKIALLIAVGVGLFFMYMSAYLMFCIKKLTKTVKFDLNELKDKTGRSYTSFEPKSKGQIEIDFNGRLSIMDAYNLTDEKINAFTAIKVEKIEDNKIYIIKI